MKLLVVEPIRLSDGTTAKPGEVIEAPPEVAEQYIKAGQAVARHAHLPRETK